MIDVMESEPKKVGSAVNCPGFAFRVLNRYLGKVIRTSKRSVSSFVPMKS
jgi:hypothetical protein